jgi:hypothetical protein
VRKQIKPVGIVQSGPCEGQRYQLKHYFPLPEWWTVHLFDYDGDGHLWSDAVREVRTACLETE